MALSPETQAIIDRLKAEGDLIRNSGTNSVRSVKIQLDKFEGIFNTISANVIEQTKILQMQAGLAQEAVEAARTKEQLDEIKTEQKKYEPEDKNNNNKTDESIEKIGDKIEKAFSARSILGTMKDLAIAGAGLFVAYNFLKGAVDEATGGSWSNMEESMANTDWNALAKSASTTVASVTNIVALTEPIMTTLSEINWEGLKTTINNMITAVENFDDWLATLPGIILGGYLFRQGIRGAVNGALDMRSGPRVGPGTAPGGAPTRGLGALRNTVLGAVTTLAWMYGDEVKNYLTDSAGVPPNIADVGVDAATMGLTFASGAATLAMMFGVTIGAPGLLLAAAVGVGLVLGKGIYDWYQDTKRDAAAAARAEMERMTAEEGIDFATGGTGGGVDLTAIPNLGALDGAEVAVLGGEAIAQGELADIVAAYRANADNAPLQEGMMEWMDNMVRILADENSSEEAKANARAQMQRLREMFPAIQADIDAMTGIGAYDAKSYFRDNIVDFMNDAAEEFSFRTGTKGFRDFGAGSFSILHGREAVVPFNTAAGRFLDQYFTENWQPKFANANNLATIAAGAGGTGTMNVIQPVNIGGSTITMADGGKSVSMINVGGGGSASPGGSMLPYGLTGAFS